ncbi:hypothetical protein BDV18DRAFT_164489 [Aspergillus unguis]
MEEIEEPLQQHQEIASLPLPPACQDSPPDSPEERRGSVNGIGSKRCSGHHPCETCYHLARECIFDESLDQRRRVAAKRTASDLRQMQNFIGNTFKAFRTNELNAYKLSRRIRKIKPGHELDLTPYVYEILESTGSHGEDLDETSQKVERFRSRILQSTIQPRQGDFMDIDLKAPIEVPAQPWTRLTTNNAIVNHLVSLWFTWEYHLYAFLDGEVFLRYMRERKLNSEFCNAFLVNAMLAVACYYWNPIDMHGIAYDLSGQGDYFLAEAEQLMDSSPNKMTIGYLQGIMMLHERYALCGRDDLGYEMLHLAIGLAEKMGIINDGHPIIPPADSEEVGRLLSEEKCLDQERAQLEDKEARLEERRGRLESDEEASEEDWHVWEEDRRMLEEQKRQLEETERHLTAKKKRLEEDRLVSLRRTAWGLFQMETAVHAGFLRPSLINRVNLRRPDKRRDKQFWQGYPNHDVSQLSLSSDFFEESCNLSEIARDMSQQLFATPSIDDMQTRQTLFERLFAWEEELPYQLYVTERPPPYVLLLRMRYHTLIILVYLYRSESEIWKPPVVGIRTPESPPSLASMRAPSREQSIEAAARSIAGLAHKYQRSHGLCYAHHFAMYAINLALFVMLNKSGPFRISDNDFLTLASCFFVITQRSQVGRRLFRMFRDTLRQRSDKDYRQLSEQIMRLLDDEFYGSEDGARLEKHASNEQPLVRGQHPLSDMLEAYETLSLGREHIARQKYHEKAY